MIFVDILEINNYTMLKEDIQALLLGLGFYETLNSIIQGGNSTHVMYGSGKLGKVVEYYVETSGLVDFIWAYGNNELKLFENASDFESWLRK